MSNEITASEINAITTAIKATGVLNGESPIEVTAALLNASNELEEDIPTGGNGSGDNASTTLSNLSIPEFTEDMIGRINKERFKGGTLTLYPYYNSKGSPVACVVRCDFKDADKPKSFTQYSWNHVNKKWQSGWSKHGKPPYNLQEIIASPDKPVMIVEGEKTAEAAKKIFPEYIITTSCMGAASPHLTNWSFLKGRNVIIAPDNDKLGKKYATHLCDILKKEEVRTINSFDSAKKLGRFTIVDGVLTTRNAPAPEKYDLADSVLDGWTAELIAEWKNHDDFTPFFETVSDTLPLEDLLQDGEELLYIEGETYKLNKKSNSLQRQVEVKNEIGLPTLIWAKLSGYIKPTHCTVDINGNHGLLVEIITRRNKTVECFFAREETATEKDTTKLLLSKGLSIPNLKPYNCYALNSYLNNFKPEFKAIGVDTVGWQNDRATYMLPFIDAPRNSYSSTQGGKQGVEYILQQKGAVSRILKRKGTLAEWQRTVGAVIKGNHLHSFAVLAALTAPALKLLGEEGGFIHYVGNTSIGKSTILHVAKSVWGFENLGSFRITDNGLEDTCKNANDGMLFLDEIGEADPEAFFKIVYMLANGVTKTRADRSGNAKPTTHFTVLAQSTGEIGLEAKLAEKGKKAKGGQLMRMAELDADRGKGLNTFDVLNINPDTGELFSNGREQAEYLKTHARENCGVVIDEFLKKIVPKVDDYIKDLQEAKTKWLKRKFTGKESAEVTRMAKRFSTIFASGVIAVSAGILPLTYAEVEACVDAMFDNWLDRFGGDSSYEFKAIVADLHKLVIEQKYARFCNACPTQDERENQPKEMAGYWHTEKREFWIYPPVFERDVLKGRDKKVFYPLLVKEGCLKKEDERQYDIKRQPKGETRQRFMVVDVSVLSPDEPTSNEPN